MKRIRGIWADIAKMQWQKNNYSSGWADANGTIAFYFYFVFYIF
jgi:hypothetical protein